MVWNIYIDYESFLNRSIWLKYLILKETNMVDQSGSGWLHPRSPIFRTIRSSLESYPIYSLFDGGGLFPFFKKYSQHTGMPIDKFVMTVDLSD